MERKFIQSMLFSTTIIVVYAMASPPLPLSAGGTTFDETTHVRKGTIISLDVPKQEYLVNFDGVSVPVVVDASTTITAPNGSDTVFSSPRDGTAIYVFGSYNKESHSIEAVKIVMRNPSILERKTMSKAEMEATKENNSPILGGLSLIKQ